MNKSRIVIVLFVLLAAAASLSAGQAVQAVKPPEKKPVDTAKLFAEIAGSYGYNVNGQDMIINFWVEGGKLYGAPQGQENEFAEVILKDAEKLFFEATPPGGQLFEIEFIRGENKKIEKSVLRSQGMEAPGVRIK
jgi:hypothetical protein